MDVKLGLPVKLKDGEVIYYSFNKNVLTLQNEKKVIARIKSLKNLISIEELNLEECRTEQDVEFLVKGKESKFIRIL